MAKARSTNRPKTDGRAADGRFVPGCKGGPGNPFAGQVQKHRAAMLAEIRADDVKLAVETIRRVLRTGKPADQLSAARELLDRVCGKPGPCDVLDQLAELEAKIAAIEVERMIDPGAARNAAQRPRT